MVKGERDEVCGETSACSEYNVRSSVITLSTPQSQTPPPPPSSEPPTPPTEPEIQQHFVPVDFNNLGNHLCSMQQQRKDTWAKIRRMMEEEAANISPAAYEYNLKEWTSWANTALDYYNKKQGAKFKFVQIVGVVSNACMPLRLVHINFGAKSDDDGSYRNFFAVMRVPWKDQPLEPIVDGCCILEKTDSGEDLNAPPCSHCSPYFDQPHPTPRYGCRSSSGDLFPNMASYY